MSVFGLRVESPVALRWTQPDGELGYLLVGRCRNVRRRDVKENEIIVVGKADHHLRVRERSVAEEIAHGGGGRLENLVELLPSVDLFDLRVAIEVEV